MTDKLAEVEGALDRDCLSGLHRVIPSKDAEFDDTIDAYLTSVSINEIIRRFLTTPIPIEGGICPECEGYKKVYDSLSKRMDFNCPTCKGTGKLDKTIMVREAIERVMG